MSGPLGSHKPSSGSAVSGVFNLSAPAPADGQACSLQLDSAGNLMVNVAVGGGGGGSNPSVGANGAAAPVSSTEIGTIDGTGKLQGVSATNPLPITGSISATNPSVGSTGATAPTSATEIGVIDGTGKLQGASATNPVRTDPTGTTTQPVSGTVNVGNSPTVNLAAATAVELLDSAGTNKASISAAGAVKIDGSAVTQPVSGTVGTNADTTIGGTTAPSKELLVAGKTNDATPQYQPLPEGPAGRSVIVEGVAGGVAQPVSESGNWNVNQAIGVAGFEKITDGTNTAAVKAASTAVAATDPSLVVALSPNSPVPTGTNTIGSVKVTDGTTVAGVIAGTTALKTDLSSVAGTAAATAAAGVQKVGIVGNAGATVDSTAAAGAAPTNAVLGSHVFNTTVPAPTAGQAVAQQCDSAGSLCVNTEGRKQTFRMSVRGFTPVASATSPLFSIQGSATKTVRITHIKISWSCTTGTALPNDVSLQKFSVLTGGTTGNTPTGAKNDTNNVAQTAVCLQYSAVPTTATAIGGISAVERMDWITSGATVNGVLPPIDWQFGNLNGQELVLRGTSEFYGIVVAAVGTTPLMSIWIEWTEE